ncbi:exo-beta-1,3-glucanase [Russula ochroleuca]|uniref:Exo-beta-1,3-glucanase n=1 Tax=Russula ochroleuca TaxID=152965 RepID=A0A9P5MY82_9AGAM|nr:exo-beta-1,3-glucanase [Russula ochroleuca]
MLSTLLLVSLLATLSFAEISQQSFSPGFPYGSQPVRGVNLGGWLVLEPWITPSLFDGTGNPAIVDEWTFAQFQDRSVAKTTLVNHWNTWITEVDFELIAGAGLNHVRIPIGYWAYQVAPGEPYIQGQHEYLLKAIGWAGNNGLKVIVDLHGVPGSQNGFDNSGHKMPYPQWQSNATNVDRSNSILNSIASEFSDNPHVVSIIAPLNEPAGFFGQQVLDVTRQYWYDSYRSIRYANGRQSNVVTLIHDAFQPLSYWNNFMPRGKFVGVAIDTHIYQMFTDQTVSLDEAGHIQSACGNAGSLSDFNENQLWTIVGEWTPAMTDCAKYLNGRGVGARYDGSIRSGAPRYGSCVGKTGKGWTFSPEYKDFLRKVWEAQVITFEKASGWIQWTWKAEQADEWSYSAGLQFGWVPQVPTDHKYPHICG